MTSLPPVKRFDWSNLGLRVASAVVLVPAALAAAWFGGWPYLVLIAIGVALLAIEWGGMSAPVSPTRVAAAVAAAVLIAIFVGYRGDFIWAWGAIFLAAAGAAVVARGVAERPADAAYGVLYIAPAALCLVWLQQTNQGNWWTIMLFAATWSADIGAFAVGSILKGPKLWPRFSPNKTWSGFFGGLVAATLAAIGVETLPDLLRAFWPMIQPFQLNVWATGLIGFTVGLATMAGDLWESALKRRFGVKDSGDLIPGHGGLLDRVDGLMFAVVVMAALRLANQLGWGH
ncbi:phosphatidate cytidylyltransferase [Phenylobacterium sp.]|uniref:phosphatidate cytidylyltransferase n=1 Tax=Phenylobacterium sp. TaxID=1871053 RepID=UPI0025D91A60|nr:phosphatidate cytidylyltransferase [Phenylobacterium sp.]MBX3482192.1 phosphatidate cytidylyltransferase [Phenylobacterium sp.]MCW5758398.1 phosphatidate cytidylyltransferase [Phenylobacterium sp.]